MRKLVLDSVGKNLVVDEEIMIDKRTVKSWVVKLIMLVIKINSTDSFYIL